MITRVNLFLIIFISIVSFKATAASDIERIVWEYDPINLTIPVGSERRIEFPESIDISTKQYILERSKVKVLGEGVVYWRAEAPFDSTLVEVVTNSGFTYLFNIEAVEGEGPSHAISILDKRYPSEEFEKTAPVVRHGVPEGGYDYVQVQRMVSHKVLNQVPKRLAVTYPGVQPVPVDPTPVPLYRSGELTATPITQWKAPEPNSFYVTAVKLTNRMSYSVQFDPYLILGDFISSSPLHKGVHKKGSDEDTMIVLLISDRSFMEAIQ